MAKHNKIGTLGEQLAKKWVLENGFTVLETNWRYKRLEADIIAFKNDTLHIIEVKTRTSTKYGLPEAGVTDKKIENMLHIGTFYQELNKQYKFQQYDILAITLNNSHPEIYYIADIYL